MSNANAPAQAITMTYGKGNYQETERHLGLTKREHFAGLVISGLVANEYRVNDSESSLAKKAVEIADALLKELEKE